MESEDELYDGITEYSHEEVSKLTSLSRSLIDENTSLRFALDAAKNQIEAAKKCSEVLKRNFGSLLKTARAEIDRKDKRISELQNRLDDVTLRRLAVSDRHLDEIVDRRVRQRTRRRRARLKSSSQATPAAGATSSSDASSQVLASLEKDNVSFKFANSSFSIVSECGEVSPRAQRTVHLTRSPAAASLPPSVNNDRSSGSSRSAGKRSLDGSVTTVAYKRRRRSDHASSVSLGTASPSAQNICSGKCVGAAGGTSASIGARGTGSGVDGTVAVGVPAGVGTGTGTGRAGGTGAGADGTGAGGARSRLAHTETQTSVTTADAATMTQCCGQTGQAVEGSIPSLAALSAISGGECACDGAVSASAGVSVSLDCPAINTAVDRAMGESRVGSRSVSATAQTQISEPPHPSHSLSPCRSESAPVLSSAARPSVFRAGSSSGNSVSSPPSAGQVTGGQSLGPRVSDSATDRTRHAAAPTDKLSVCRQSVHLTSTLHIEHTAEQVSTAGVGAYVGGVCDQVEGVDGSSGATAATNTTGPVAQSPYSRLEQEMVALHRRSASVDSAQLPATPGDTSLVAAAAAGESGAGPAGDGAGGGAVLAHSHSSGVATVDAAADHYQLTETVKQQPCSGTRDVTRQDSTLNSDSHHSGEKKSGQTEVTNQNCTVSVDRVQSRVSEASNALTDQSVVSVVMDGAGDRSRSATDKPSQCVSMLTSAHHDRPQTAVNCSSDHYTEHDSHQDRPLSPLSDAKESTKPTESVARSVKVSSRGGTIEKCHLERNSCNGNLVSSQVCESHSRELSPERSSSSRSPIYRPSNTEASPSRNDVHAKSAEPPPVTSGISLGSSSSKHVPDSPHSPSSPQDSAPDDTSDSFPASLSSHKRALLSPEHYMQSAAIEAAGLTSSPKSSVDLDQDLLLSDDTSSLTTNATSVHSFVVQTEQTKSVNQSQSPSSLTPLGNNVEPIGDRSTPSASASPRHPNSAQLSRPLAQPGADLPTKAPSHDHADHRRGHDLADDNHPVAPDESDYELDACLDDEECFGLDMDSAQLRRAGVSPSQLVLPTSTAAPTAAAGGGGGAAAAAAGGGAAATASNAAAPADDLSTSFTGHFQSQSVKSPRRRSSPLATKRSRATSSSKDKSYVRDDRVSGGKHIKADVANVKQVPKPLRYVDQDAARPLYGSNGNLSVEPSVKSTSSVLKDGKAANTARVSGVVPCSVAGTTAQPMTLSGKQASGSSTISAVTVTPVAEELEEGEIVDTDSTCGSARPHQVSAGRPIRRIVPICLSRTVSKRSPEPRPAPHTTDSYRSPVKISSDRIRKKYENQKYRSSAVAGRSGPRGQPLASPRKSRSQHPSSASCRRDVSRSPPASRPHQWRSRRGEISPSRGGSERRVAAQRRASDRRCESQVHHSCRSSRQAHTPERDTRHAAAAAGTDSPSAAAAEAASPATKRRRLVMKQRQDAIRQRREKREQLQAAGTVGSPDLFGSPVPSHRRLRPSPLSPTTISSPDAEAAGAAKLIRYMDSFMNNTPYHEDTTIMMTGTSDVSGAGAATPAPVAATNSPGRSPLDVAPPAVSHTATPPVETGVAAPVANSPSSWRSLVAVDVPSHDSVTWSKVVSLLGKGRPNSVLPEMAVTELTKAAVDCGLKTTTPQPSLSTNKVEVPTTVQAPDSLNAADCHGFLHSALTAPPAISSRSTCAEIVCTAISAEPVVPDGHSRYTEVCSVGAGSAVRNCDLSAEQALSVPLCSASVNSPMQSDADKLSPRGLTSPQSLGPHSLTPPAAAVACATLFDAASSGAVLSLKSVRVRRRRSVDKNKRLSSTSLTGVSVLSFS